MRKVSSTVPSPIRLAIVSCGLGRINRGFEVAALRWADAIKVLEEGKSQSEIDTRLFSGGAQTGATSVWNLPRDGTTNNILKYVKIIKDGCRVEQVSFAVGFLRHLFLWKPDVIWTQEFTFARTIQLIGRCFPWIKSPKILFCNGAPNGPEHYKFFEFIQHLHVDSFNSGLQYGVPEERMSVLPYCVPVSKTLDEDAKGSIRRSYNVSEHHWIVVCVAAWNRHHKRIDYLLREAAESGISQLQLILCGQPESDIQSLQELGRHLLGNKVQWHTLPSERIQDVLGIADVFVLPSLSEGLGLVLIEAAMNGIPIVSHPHAGGKFVVGNNWPLIDMSKEGTLAARLIELYQCPPNPEQVQSIQAQAICDYSSESLAPKFAEIIKRALEK